MQNLFLSWSGPRAQAAAQAFSTFINAVINEAVPFLSMEIPKGTRGDNAIATALNDCKCGVVFLTPGNLTKPWILFEAGAISKAVENEAYCCTFLIDLRPSDIEPPLGNFQHTIADRDDVWKLVQTINVAVGAARSEPSLRFVFDGLWASFKNALDSLPSEATPTAQAPRPDRAVLDEILELVRVRKPALPPSLELLDDMELKEQEAAKHPDYKLIGGMRLRHSLQAITASQALHVWMRERGLNDGRADVKIGRSGVLITTDEPAFYTDEALSYFREKIRPYREILLRNSSGLIQRVER